MKTRQYILRDLEAEFNTNAQGIKFAFKDPAGIYNSNFTTDRFGTGVNENWYDVITEEIVPVVISSFNAGFMSHPNIRGFSGNIQLSFLVDADDQVEIVAAMEEVINRLPGLNIDLLDNDDISTGYNITLNSSFPLFVVNELYNETRYIQYNLDISVLALEQLLSANNIKLEMQSQALGTGYVELPILNYTPNRARETTAVQKPSTNSIVSIVRNSAWLASFTFYVSLKEEGNITLKQFSQKIIEILENSTLNQNELFDLRITYKPFNNYTVNKTVLISNIQTTFVRDDMASITLQVEEAYTTTTTTPAPEVINNG